MNAKLFIQRNSRMQFEISDVIKVEKLIDDLCKDTLHSQNIDIINSSPLKSSIVWKSQTFKDKMSKKI